MKNTTAAPTIADVKRMLQKDGRIEGLSVSWVRKPRFVTCPTGAKVWLGWAAVQAPGYRARTMIVDRDERGTMVR